MENPKTPWQKLFDPNYLGSWSLEPKEELTATITRTETQKVRNNKGEEKDKIVIHLDRAPRNGLHLPMIVGNKENARMMERIAGSAYIEDWVGKKICVFVAKVKAFGEMTEALRIRQPANLKTLPNDRFAKMLKAIKDGQFTVEQARDFNLTTEQEQQLSAL